jgi:hypothetical protein
MNEYGVELIKYFRYREVSPKNIFIALPRAWVDSLELELCRQAWLLPEYVSRPFPIAKDNKTAFVFRFDSNSGFLQFWYGNDIRLPIKRTAVLYVNDWTAYFCDWFGDPY